MNKSKNDLAWKRYLWKKAQIQAKIQVEEEGHVKLQQQN